MKKGEKQRWHVFEESNCIHVLPSPDSKPHRIWNGKDKEVVIADLNCPCKPKIDFSHTKPLIIHHSFENMEMINKSMNEESDFCLRCGFDKKFIKKEKSLCSVWGKSYKKHMYK